MQRPPTSQSHTLIAFSGPTEGLPRSSWRAITPQLHQSCWRMLAIAPSVSSAVLRVEDANASFSGTQVKAWGLHVVVPFVPGPTWAEAKNFARTDADVLAQAEPDRFTINSRKDVRAGRIFIDYLRNDETASAVAAYSVRARPGAPVSMPIDWRELSRLKAGDAFNMKDALKRRKDAWAGLANASRQRLPREMDAT